MVPHFLDGIDDIPIDSSVAIYGTGDYGKSLFQYIEKMRPDIEVYCFFDSYLEGTKYGKSVFKSENILALQNKFQMILVGSEAYRIEIHKELQRQGYIHYYDIWFYPSMLYETEECISASLNGSSFCENKNNILYAFYDLRVSPYSFDMFTFLLLAEIRRVETKKDRLYIVIVKDIQSGNKWDWNIFNILLPLTKFITSVSGVTVTFPDGFIENIIREQDCFPTFYSLDVPVSAYTVKTLTTAIRQVGFKPNIFSTEVARTLVRDWKKLNNVLNNCIVTITLRQSPGYSDRNSSVDQWLLFADYLKANGYTPLLLKDTYSVFNPEQEGLDGYLTFDEASLNLELRMALYESSYLNMSIANGPMVLCLYSNHVPYLNHMKLNDNYWASQPRYLAEMGLPVESQFPLAKSNQILKWSYDDRLDTLKQEFEEYVLNNPFIGTLLPS